MNVCNYGFTIVDLRENHLTSVSSVEGNTCLYYILHYKYTEGEVSWSHGQSECYQADFNNNCSFSGSKLFAMKYVIWL